MDFCWLEQPSKDKDGKLPEGWAASGYPALHHTPFTAVFAADGRLSKRLYEPEDEEARQRAESGDPRYTSATTRAGNNFVMSGDVAAGSDGNLYLLHGGPVPLVYVISPAGAIVRKLRIETADFDSEDYVADSIKSYDGRLAIGFWRPDSKQSLVKITDMKGNSIANYDIRKDGLAQNRSLSLTCYGPKGLTMLGDMKNKLLLFRVSVP